MLAAATPTGAALLRGGVAMDHSPPTCTCRLHIFGTGEFQGESSATVALFSVTILLEGVVLETVPSVVAGLRAAAPCETHSFLDKDGIRRSSHLLRDCRTFQTRVEEFTRQQMAAGLLP